MAILGVVVIGRAFYIQRVEGKFWTSMGDSMHLKYLPIGAERGTIYSEDGNILSTSLLIAYYQLLIVNYLLIHFFSATLSFALLDLVFCFNSSADAVIGFLVISFKGFSKRKPYTSSTSVSAKLPLRKKIFTIRSSSE